MKRILFVCVENSNRSQIAEAFARQVGGVRVDVHSAGSNPSGRVNPRAIEAMRAVGYDLSVHRSKAISAVPDGPYDAVVSMGCGEGRPEVSTECFEDWPVPDPKHMDPLQFAEVRDGIRVRVEALLERLLQPSES